MEETHQHYINLTFREQYSRLTKEESKLEFLPEGFFFTKYQIRSLYIYVNEGFQFLICDNAKKHVVTMRYGLLTEKFGQLCTLIYQHNKGASESFH